MHLDVDQMLATGAISGPYRRAHPQTLSLLARIRRAIRAWINDHRKGPL